MTTVTLSSKNQVVIPKEVREGLGLKGGDQIIIGKAKNGTYTVKKAPSFYDLIGILEPGNGDPVERIRKLRDEPWRGQSQPPRN